jgi:hypothetical protein
VHIGRGDLAGRERAGRDDARMEGAEFTKNGSAQEGAKLTWEYRILQGGVPTAACNGLAPQGRSQGASSQRGAPPLIVGQLLTGATGQLLEAVSQSCSSR